MSALVERLESAFSVTRLNASVAHHRQKLYYNEDDCIHAYEMKALVWLNKPTENSTQLEPH